MNSLYINCLSALIFPEMSKYEDNYDADRGKIFELLSSVFNLNTDEPLLDFLFEGFDYTQYSINKNLINFDFDEIENQEKKDNISNEKEINDNINDIQQENWIEGILDIKLNEINKYLVLFKTEMNYDVDIYINDKKIPKIKFRNNWVIRNNFNKEGRYKFKIVFLDNI